MSTEQPRDDERPVEPHPKANELVEPEELTAAGRHGGPAPQTRRAGRLGLIIGAGILALGVILAAVLFRSGWLIAIAAIVIIAYMILLLAPVVLAEGTKVAQDESAGRRR